MSAIEQRAKELLAAEMDRSGRKGTANKIRQGRPAMFREELRAIIAALTPPEGFVLVSAELLEDLAAEAESGIHQTVFIPSKRERRMAFVKEARALIAASPEAK